MLRNAFPQVLRRRMRRRYAPRRISGQKSLTSPLDTYLRLDEQRWRQYMKEQTESLKQEESYTPEEVATWFTPLGTRRTS